MIGNQLPEKLTNFKVYKDGIMDLVGLADVNLPSVEYLTEKIKGSGIAGEYDSIVKGHAGSMTLKLKFRSLVKDITFLSEPHAHDFDIRGAVQEYDTVTGEITTKPVVLKVRGVPKKSEFGKFETGKSTNTTAELEVIYLKVKVQGVKRVEIDKVNYKYEINGKDYLLDERIALGII